MLKYDAKSILDSRTILLNHLIKKFNYKSYLEIGLGLGINFNLIQCSQKICVDPDPKLNPNFKMTSDEFFSKNKNKYDLIFIDGFHSQNQVCKDVNNSLECINLGGTIVVHDCLPENEIQQLVLQQTKFWTGDVWKGFVKFVKEFNNSSFVVDVDFGCGIIECDTFLKKIKCVDLNLDWKVFSENKKEILNVITFEDFLVRVEKRKSNKKNF